MSSLRRASFASSAYSSWMVVFASPWLALKEVSRPISVCANGRCAKTGKPGYAPVCSNKFVPGVCELPKVKCGECLAGTSMRVTRGRWTRIPGVAAIGVRLGA